MTAMGPGEGQVKRFPSETSIPLNAPGQGDGSTHGSVGSLDEASARASQLSSLLEVSNALAGALDLPPTLKSILSRLAERENLSLARISLVDESAGAEVLAEINPTPAIESIPPKDSALQNWVIQQDEEVYVPRVDLDPRCQRWDSERVRSAYLVPLRSEEGLRGVFTAGVDHANGIRSSTRNLIDQMAVQIARALDRNKAFQLLRGSEQRFQSIFDQESFGIVFANLDGRFTKVNSAFAHLLGSTCEGLEGKHFAEMTDPQDASIIERWVRQLRDGHKSRVCFEGSFLRQSGESLWCAVNITLLREGAGNSPQLLAVVQDITARKKAEEEHHQLEQQLFQAQKMEALGTLAGGIAHDFNNLLSVMLGFASLARLRLDVDDPLHDSMGMIEESAKRAADLARQLLGFARPEMQPVAPVCVQEVVRRVRRMVERTFDRSIKVEASLAPEPIWVNAEPSYLEQALLNLCLNARDAMPKGGRLALEVAGAGFDSAEGKTSHPNSSAPQVKISIQDSGLGISPEDLPRIFEPFFSSKAPSRGTGLGLSMVYTFVKNHAGEVKVESLPGKGSVFTVALPTVAAPPAHSASDVGGIEPARGTVLVVDDEPLVRAFACEGLMRIGYDVLIAEDGAKALEIYARHPGKIDCVLLDLIMPELSGLETYLRLREAHPQAVVLFASGYSTGQILREEPEARHAAFIGKPYSLESLASKLRTTIAGKKCCP